MAGAEAKGVLLDVGGVLLPTPWELLEDFEGRNGWPPGTLPWRGPLDPDSDPLWRSVRALVADARAGGRRTGLLTSKLVAFLSREVVLVRRRLGL